MPKTLQSVPSRANRLAQSWITDADFFQRQLGTAAVARLAGDDDVVQLASAASRVRQHMVGDQPQSLKGGVLFRVSDSPTKGPRISSANRFPRLRTHHRDATKPAVVAIPLNERLHRHPARHSWFGAFQFCQFGWSVFTAKGRLHGPPGPHNDSVHLVISDLSVWRINSSASACFPIM